MSIDAVIFETDLNQIRLCKNWAILLRSKIFRILFFVQKEKRQIKIFDS